MCQPVWLPLACQRCWVQHSELHVTTLPILDDQAWLQIIAALTVVAAKTQRRNTICSANCEERHSQSTIGTSHQSLSAATWRCISDELHCTKTRCQQRKHSELHRYINKFLS